MTTDRRSFLSGIGAVLGVTGLSGCLSGNTLLSDGEGEEPTGWQYDPSTLAQTQNRFFGRFDYADLYRNREYLPESTRESFEGSPESPIQPSDVDLLTGVGGGQLSPTAETQTMFGSMALTGSFDRETLVQSVESSGNASQSGTYEGYALYEDVDSTGYPATGTVPSGPSVSAAIGDGAMVIGIAATGRGDAEVTGEEATTTMIDASLGEVPLLEDNSQYAGALMGDALGSSMQAGGEIDPELLEMAESQYGPQQQRFVAGLRAGGFGATIEGATTTFTVAGVYESASAAESTGVVEFVESLGEGVARETEGVRSIDASYLGSVTTVSVTGDTRTVFAERGPASPGTAFGIGPGTV